MGQNNNSSLVHIVLLCIPNLGTAVNDEHRHFNEVVMALQETMLDEEFQDKHN